MTIMMLMKWRKKSKLSSGNKILQRFKSDKRDISSRKTNKTALRYNENKGMETPECWKTFKYGIYKEMTDRNNKTNK